MDAFTNVGLADGYTTGNTFYNERAVSAFVVIYANAPCAFQVLKRQANSREADTSAEVQTAGGAFSIPGCGGLRMRNAIAGSQARVSVYLFTPSDAPIQGFNPITVSINAAGQI